MVQVEPPSVVARTRPAPAFDWPETKQRSTDGQEIPAIREMSGRLSCVQAAPPSLVTIAAPMPLDGSEPTTSDPVYAAPFPLTVPQVVRARAYKPGFTRSITAQQVFVPKG